VTDTMIGVPAYTMETVTGKRLDPLKPSADQICIEDIAHALANLCRFTGHTREFYSVAQHSVLVSIQVPTRFKLAAILHDASEAYLNDLARPVKHQPAILAVYGPAEDRLMEMIAAKYGFPWPMPQQVKAADDLLCRAEGRDLMPGTNDWWKLDGQEPVHPPIEPWTPQRAKRAFQNCVTAYSNGLRLKLVDLL
jgi:hypothetical protein